MTMIILVIITKILIINLVDYNNKDSTPFNIYPLFVDSFNDSWYINNLLVVLGLKLVVVKGESNDGSSGKGGNSANNDCGE